MAGEGNRLGCLPERFSRPLPFTLRIVILQVFTLTTTELLGQLSSELSSESLSAYETLGAASLIRLNLLYLHGHVYLQGPHAAHLTQRCQIPLFSSVS